MNEVKEYIFKCPRMIGKTTWAIGILNKFEDVIIVTNNLDMVKCMKIQVPKSKKMRIFSLRQRPRPGLKAKTIIFDDCVYNVNIKTYFLLEQWMRIASERIIHIFTDEKGDKLIRDLNGY